MTAVFFACLGVAVSLVFALYECVSLALDCAWVKRVVRWVSLRIVRPALALAWLR